MSSILFTDLNVTVLTDLRPVTPLVLTTRSPSLRDGSNSSTTLNSMSSSLTSSENISSGFSGRVKLEMYCFRSSLYSFSNLASSARFVVK